MRMDNLGALELNELRPFVSTVMDQLRKLVATIEPSSAQEDQTDQYDDEFSSQQQHPNNDDDDINNINTHSNELYDNNHNNY